MRTAIVAACLLAPSLAFAHAALTYPPPRNTLLKTGPCGAANSTRGTNVTTLTAGSTVTVKWTETIEHPGHFRLSFDTDGQDFVVPPTANGNTEGMTNVVKDLIADISGPAPHMYQLDITLPNVECTNCTLQLIQLMTDKAPYTTDAASDDIYYSCADITLVASAPDAGPVATPDAGMDPGGGGGGNNNGGGGEINGGCSTGGNATGLVALVGLLGLRRRRRA